MAPRNQVKRIDIVVRDQGSGVLKKISNQMDRLNRNVRQNSVSFSALRNIMTGFIASIGLRELAQAADSFQLIQDRIRVFSGSAQEASDTFDGIVSVARTTKTSVENIGTSFNRLAIATKELGLSNDQVLATSQALQQTFRLSGATIAEATAATIQLSQGLASGQLRGQELRSVLEQNAVFSNLLAKELGTTTGNLIKFAEQGTITSEVVLRALGKNFDQLNQDANQLGTTFNQSLTIALDAFRVKLAELNREFDISGRFARGIEFIIDNFDTLGKILLSFSVLIVPKAIEALGKLRAALFSVNGILGVISVAITFLALDWEKNIIRMELVALRFGVRFPRTALFIQKALEKISAAAKFVAEQVGRAFNFIAKLFDTVDKTFTRGKLTDEQKELTDNFKKRIIELEAQLERLNNAGKKTTKDLSDAGNSLKNISIASKEAVGGVAALNAAYSDGALSLRDYREQVANLELDELNRKWKEGKIQVDDYNNSVAKLASETEKLNALSAGVEAGLNSYGRAAENLGTQISSSISNGFKKAEDSVISFTKTGTFEFKKFADALIDDLLRVAIRSAILGPLASAFGSLFSPSPAGGGGLAASGGINAGGLGLDLTPNASGNAFNNGNVIPFANGGVVSGTSFFPMSGGRTGMMGEAGPEAILPLKRGPDGNLGVTGSGSNVTVNIINESGAGVEQQERRGQNGDRILDVIITSGINKAIANGSLDRTFGDTYGLRRRGR